MGGGGGDGGDGGGGGGGGDGGSGGVYGDGNDGGCGGCGGCGKCSEQVALHSNPGKSGGAKYFVPFRITSMLGIPYIDNAFESCMLSNAGHTQLTWFRTGKQTHCPNIPEMFSSPAESTIGTYYRTRGFVLIIKALTRSMHPQLNFVN